MPRFEITEDQKNNLKTISAVSKMLAEDPTLAKEIASVFDEVTQSKDKELADRVSKILSEKVAGVKEEDAKALFRFWFILYLPPEKVPPTLWFPH